MSLKVIDYINFGRCVELTGGPDEQFRALITIDIGPRIINYGLKDGRNVFFEDVGRKISHGGDYLDKNFRIGEKWFLYGGHRLWRAPEDNGTYVPDNYPVEYKPDELNNGAYFFQPPQTDTKLRFSMSAHMDRFGALTVRHKIENAGSYTARFAVWAVSVMKAGGTEIIPLNNANTGFLPNNNFSYWPYNDMNDKRLKAIDGYLLLNHDNSIKRAFKLGLMNKTGAAAYCNDGLIFIKKFPYINGAVYPDNNCNYETYTNDLLLEMESISPMYEVEPGKSAEMTEVLSIIEREISLNKSELDILFKV